ncbi:uncharacterized protein ACO6RY_01399 [Pungitius sinensis]
MTTCQQGTRRDVGVVGDEKGGRKGGRKVWWTIKHPLHPFPSLHHYSDFYSPVSSNQLCLLGSPHPREGAAARESGGKQNQLSGVHHVSGKKSSLRLLLCL